MEVLMDHRVWKYLWITEYGSTDGSLSMEVLMDH